MKKQFRLFALIASGLFIMPAFADTPAKYNQSCIACHASGAAGAPKTHDVAAWKPRLEKGMAKLLENTKKGINAMPPKGMCMDCSDAEYEALITFMSQPAAK